MVIFYNIYPVVFFYQIIAILCLEPGVQQSLDNTYNVEFIIIYIINNFFRRVENMATYNHLIVHVLCLLLDVIKTEQFNNFRCVQSAF